MDVTILNAFVDEIEKIGMSTADIKKKMDAPPTGDTGPNGPDGKGKEDPRFKANVARGFVKRGLSKKAASWVDSLKARP
jgi:hypothetical protein